MKPVRFGLIGCGGVAEDHALSIRGERAPVEEAKDAAEASLLGLGRQLARRLLGRNNHKEEKVLAPGIEGAEIVAISDVNRERLARFSHTYEIRDTYEDYRELLARKDIDAVIISTPPTLHPEITIAAAQRGKHVFCEKPMALTSSQCGKMIEATEKARVILQIGYVLRFSSDRERIREAIQNNQIGRPVFWREIYNPRAGGTQRWVHDQDLGRGVLWENSHMLDFIRYVFGDPDLVSAIGGRYKPDDTSALDTIGILLTFPSGDKALLTDSYALKGFNWSTIGRRRNQLQIDVVGTKGVIQFPDRDLSERLTIQTYADPKDQIETIPWSNEWGANGYKRELEHFCDCVREGKPSRAPGSEGLRTIQLAETILRSIQTGNVCRFSEA